MAESERLILFSPLAGWASALDEVPDPVFAERMMGDGLAIDPVEARLVAPCDATVVLVPESGHSVTLRAANGAEILIHIGIETVALAGRGFSARVSTGDSVRRGDTLIEFDLDAVLAGATSLVTPVVLANGEGFRLEVGAVDRAVRIGEPIGTITALSGDITGGAGSDSRHVAELVVALPNGIHARPAARIAALAKSFAAEVSVEANGKHANARSPVALMVLGAKLGDRLQIVGSGTDARVAVDALVELIEHGIEDHARVASPAPPAAAPATPADGILSGVCAAPGLALGTACQLRVRDLEVPEHGSGEAAERSALQTALAAVAKRLSPSGATDEALAVGEAHRALLDDVELHKAAEQQLAAGRSAGFAWRSALRGQAEQLRATGNTLLQERIDDLLDLERQVLTELAGDQPDGLSELPEGAILLADEILPSQLLGISPGRPAGICTARGGPTSHAAILAAAAGVPMLVAAGEAVTRIPHGTRLLLDAAAGRLVIEPDGEVSSAAEAQISAAAALSERERASAAEDCRMADGMRIEVFANLGSVAEAGLAVASGAEGCGLLRSEFLFLDRATAPSVEEQRTAYQAIADALGERPLIVRTLDVGGDKPIPYLALPQEENPALGLRGVRTSLWRLDLLDDQLRAILGVMPAGRCRIMVPMIVSLDELRAVRSRLDALAAELGVSAKVELGIMIETPAAALLADQLATEADFFSVGSNDLTQYALAMDRGNPLVAAHVDGFHPAVLRLIANAGQAAHAHQRLFAVCGGLASDPGGAMLLVGLGVTEMSVTPAAVPRIKEALRRTTLESCTSLASRALDAESPQAVRALIDAALAEAQGEA